MPASGTESGSFDGGRSVSVAIAVWPASTVTRVVPSTSGLLQLGPIQDVQQAGSHGNGGMFRIAAGREGVGRIGADHVDAGLRKPCVHGQAIDD